MPVGVFLPHSARVFAGVAAMLLAGTYLAGTCFAGEALAQATELRRAGAGRADAPEGTVLSLRADGRLFVGTDPAADDEIEAKLLAVGGRDRRIYLRAERHGRYERVVQVMDIRRRSGFTQVALVSSDGR